MKTTSPSKTLLTATAILLAAAAPAAALDPLLEAAEGPREFHLTDSHDRENIDFDETKHLRLCLGANEQMVPLRVDFGADHASIVRPGECLDFQAKTVEVSPEKPLESGWVLSGEIETRTVPAKPAG